MSWELMLRGILLWRSRVFAGVEIACATPITIRGHPNRRRLNAMNKIKALISDLAAVPGSATLVNLFSFEHPELDRSGAAAFRRANCEAYLRRFIENPPRLIIVGEAGGYQGMRFSGIAFTSEYTLQQHPFFPAADSNAARCASGRFANLRAASSGRRSGSSNIRRCCGTPSHFIHIVPMNR